MPDTRADLEAAAREENDWVRARILKRDPPAGSSCLEAAERARRMAANSLGERHEAYAVALQNLGLFHDVIEGDSGKADRFLAEASAILGGNKIPLAAGLYALGLFQLTERGNSKRALDLLSEAARIGRSETPTDSSAMARTLVALALAEAAEGDVAKGIALTDEALQFLHTQHPAGAEEISQAEIQLARLRRLAPG
jgi:hypothetical protein